VVGLAAEGSVSLEQVDLDGPLVIVTGSEGDGLSMLTRKHCDQLVSIPLRGATPSLNASVATALLLYEVARRGWMKGLRGGDPAPRIVRPQLPAPQAEAELPSLAAADEPILGEVHTQADNQVDTHPAAASLPLSASHGTLEPEPEPEPPQVQDDAQAPGELEQEPVAGQDSQDEQALPALPAVELGLPVSPYSTFQGDVQL
jgi:23S rRNA (guanosine2251-2'-O)-methyltransferase